jgi:hypothetical protein
LSPLYKRYLNALVKIGIIVLAAIFIWKRLSENKNLDDFLLIVRHLNLSRVITTLSLVAALMFTNWLTESFKWQLQLKNIAPISLWTSIQSVFCGLTVGIITPNRIGDYGTRVFFLRPRQRVYGLVAMATGALAQFIVMTGMATVVICIFLHRFTHIDPWVIVALGALLSTLFAGLLLLYFNMDVIRLLMNKVKFLSRYEHFFSVLYANESLLLIKIVLLYVLRTVILITQYYLIIHLLIPSLSFFEVVLMVALLISLQAITPTIEILDIGVRGATAVYFFSFITKQDVSILATTSVIWFINLIVPAIIGLCFVHKLKLFKVQAQ